MRISEELYNVLKLVTGKTVAKKSGIADVIESYVDAYTCTVTFTTVPSGATVVVKDSQGNTVTPTSTKVYALKRGTYSYTVTADGYATVQSTLALNINDIAGETKTVSITMVANA